MRVELTREDRAIVHSRPTPRLLAVLTELEGPRRWIKAGGLSITASEHNLDILARNFPDLHIDRPELAQEWVDEFDGHRAPYKPKTELYDHQRRALEKMRQQDVFALFMEQGTGKTKVAIDRAGELYCGGRITGVLVVAKKGVHRQWIESQLPEHMGCEWTGHYWLKNSFKRASKDDGSGLEWATINFDGVKTQKGKEQTINFLKRHVGRVLIIGDETQEIKNTRSARYKTMVELKRVSRSPYRFALTGTPISKDLTDEWAQLKWLEESIIGIRYITAFRNEYCIMGGFEDRMVIGHKNLERFREKVEPYTFRSTKDELGILPKDPRKWVFDLDPKQKQAIHELKQDLKHKLETGDIVSSANAAVALTKIQQVSNGFIVDENSAAHDIVPIGKNPRINALLEVLDAYEGKTIVWARFRHDIALIAQALRKAKISFVEYHGGTPDKDRGPAIDSFLGEGGARVFLSNPQAGGTGLNLQGACRHAVYYSNSFNAIDRWQSEDRIHRIGTTDVVTYTDLYCKGALDAHILNNLKKKKGISDLALDDIKKWADDEDF